MASPKVSCGSRVVSRPCCGEEIDEALADRVDASLVVAAAVGVHRVAQQVQHRLLLGGQPFSDFRFVRRDLGHVQGSGRQFAASMVRGAVGRLSPNTLLLTGRVERRALRAPNRVGCLW